MDLDFQLLRSFFIDRFQIKLFGITAPLGLICEGNYLVVYHLADDSSESCSFRYYHFSDYNEALECFDTYFKKYANYEVASK